jgi:hypothetical protein
MNDTLGVINYWSTGIKSHGGQGPICNVAFVELGDETSGPIVLMSQVTIESTLPSTHNRSCGSALADSRHIKHCLETPCRHLLHRCKSCSDAPQQGCNSL